MAFLQIQISFGQQNNKTDQQKYEPEKMDDPYLPMLKTRIKTTPAYFYTNSGITITQVNVDSDGNNILNDAANEPSIAVDPNDSSRIVIGWRQFENIESNFRQAGNASTTDRGQSWIYSEPIEAELFRSDPVLSSDNNGTIYYNSLSSDFFCDVFKTYDLTTWEDKTYAFGGDKQWMVIDKTDQPSNGNIYAFWKEQYSDCPDNNFTRSTDSGDSYEECSLIASNPTRGTLAIGPDGEVYACGGWSNTHRVLRSDNAKDPGAAVTWEVDKIVDLKGEQALYDGPNPGGMLGQVWVAANHSDVYYGEVYLLSTVARDDNGDPADIMFSKSTDGGQTWSEAIKINDDNSTENWQWFGTMSVAPNGRIDVVWVDTRDNPGTFLSALYYSFSIDGGESWSTNEKMSDAFDPHLGWPNQEKMGDYYHMVSFNDGAHLAWAATFTGGQDIYYSYIPNTVTTDISEINQNNLDEIALKIIPNPVLNEAIFDITLKQNSTVKVSIVDIEGRVLVVFPKHYLSKGNNKIQWNPNRNNLNSGIYFVYIENESGVIYSQRFVLFNN
jgi:hypothetical protein